MKKSPGILTYLFALVIGVLLLCFTGKTNLFESIVIIIGILFMIPSVWLIVTSFITRRDPDGQRINKPWYVGTAGCFGLIFGILLVCMPGFFSAYIIYTLGVVMILCGLAQIVFFSQVSSAVGSSRWFYLMPWITFVAGIVVLLFGPRLVENVATIVTGCVLIVYAVNGFVGMGSQSRRGRLLDIDRRRVEAERASEARQ